MRTRPLDFAHPEPTETRIVSSITGSMEQPGSTIGNLLQVYGLADLGPASVSIDAALEVPAVLAAVSFLSRTMASVPLHAYRSTSEGAQRISGGLQTLIHEAPNPQWTSFEWRRYSWQQTFTGGRSLSWIERSGSNILAIWPINPALATVKIAHGVRTYEVGSKVYSAADIIDVPFMLKADMCGAHGPIARGARAIRLALAMEAYASSFFAGGGVPPLSLSGPMPAGAEAVKRAQADIHRAIEASRRKGEPVFPIPAGYELKPVGFDPEKGQMTEARRLQVEEIARIFNLPPVFLQDLTHGTFSNTEQQDLHLVKHLVAQWAQAFEQELNLKLFGQRNGARYVEHNLDGLLRGDFATRMNGMAQAIQNGLLTPNEGRALDNRPPMPNGDELMIQGATVPLGTQSKNGATDGSGTPGANSAA